MAESVLNARASIYRARFIITMRNFNNSASRTLRTDPLPLLFLFPADEVSSCLFHAVLRKCLSTARIRKDFAVLANVKDLRARYCLTKVKRLRKLQASVE